MMLSGLFMALMTYTRIPIPGRFWRDDGNAYVLAFLPICGVIISLVMLTTLNLPLNHGFLAALLTVIPILISGGIHFDGFLDTVDALSSHAPRERKLIILKDSSSGAFAVMYACVIFVLQYGAWVAILASPKYAAGAILAPIYARAMCVLMLLFLPDARPGGSASTFVTAARDSGLTAQLVILCAFLLMSFALGGGTIPAIAAVISVLFCRRIFMREFGGMTGDLAGYFIIFTETCALILSAIF